jgi:hypothetical protein
MTSVTVSLTSNSTGEFAFVQSLGGPGITNFNILPGSFQGVFYYRDYRATNGVTLTASAPSLTSANAPITIAPAAYAKLQVLLPGQTTDPGRPIGDPLGRNNNPTTVTAGNPVIATANAVDNWFNLISTIANPVSFTTNDPSAPPNVGTVSLAGGTGNQAVTFYTPGNNLTTTGTDLSTSKTGTSDQVTVLAGANSSLLDVVHASPALSTGVLGQPVTMMTFQLKIQVGSNPSDLTSLQLHAKDRTGADIPMNTAFQTLTLQSASAVTAYNVSAVSSPLFTLGTFTTGTFTVTSSNNLAVTLLATVSSSATAKNVQLFVDSNTSVTAKDDTTGNPMGITAQGDSTGFPMASGVLALMPPDIASTYGNYPNPFRAGMESTTIEFFLPSASTVSLVVYDIMGNRAKTLLDNQSLPAGLQRVLWDGRGGMGSFVVNGVYYGQLDVNGSKLLLKIAVVK